MKQLIPIALLTSALCCASEQPLNASHSPRYDRTIAHNAGLALFHMSDTHADRNRNKDQVDIICTILRQSGSIFELPKSNTATELAARDAMIGLSGDCIDGISGMDHHRRWFWLLQCLPWFQKGRRQTEEFKSVYLNPLEQTETPIVLCDGNHDQADPTDSLRDLITAKHGGLCYATQQGGLHTIVCGKYPDKKACEWLSDRLANLNGAPCAIMFHYNLAGPYSNNWSDKEKDRFYNTIEGHNVQLILHGHHHSTHMYNWKGIQAANSGGGVLPVHFFDNRGNYEKSIGLDGIAYTDASGKKQLHIKEVALSHK